jgi:hypothetical protein
MGPVVARTAIGWSSAYQGPVQIRLRPSLNVIDWTWRVAFLCHAKRAEPHGFRVDAVSLSLQPGFEGRLSLGGLFSLAS